MDGGVGPAARPARASERRRLVRKRQDGPRRLRREPASGGRKDRRRDGHRVGIHPRGGRALLGGYGKRGVLTRRQPSVAPPTGHAHSLGYGREAYVWALLAAVGLFVAGAVLSVTHGVQELVRPEPATNFIVGYAVLAVSLVLEGVSFLRSVRQAKPGAQLMERDVIEQVMTSLPKTRRR